MSLNINQQKFSERFYQRKWEMSESAMQLLKAITEDKEKEQTFQKRYDYQVSQKYEAMGGQYDGWSSSTDALQHHSLSASLVYQDALQHHSLSASLVYQDALQHHSLSASLVYQDALTAGVRLKVEGE
ncbi:hypothetical protein QUF51_08215 [Bacillus pumilus]|nr:hypothetical protein [Bacillus pumilus]